MELWELVGMGLDGVVPAQDDPGAPIKAAGGGWDPYRYHWPDIFWWLR